MYELHHRINPKEVVVGWCVQLFQAMLLLRSNYPRYRYSTGSNLNANSALIQNLYSQEAAPLQAVHLVIDTGLEESGKGAGVKAYIR
jgi:translation initiation factor 3 subunit F